MTRFDYKALPLGEIAKRYRQGESWRALARAYQCPDDKTLARYVIDHDPALVARDHTKAQQLRRAREGARQTTKKQIAPWWKRG